MLRKRFIYYIIALFVIGNGLLIFIEYTSTKKLNLLISGNEKVISELRVRNDLKELDGDITYVDNKIAAALYTRDSSHLAGMNLKINEVKSDIDRLQGISDDDTSVKYIDVLDRLVRTKLLFGKRVLDTLYHSGRPAAESLMNSDSAKRTDDSIKTVTNIIETSRQKLLASVILSINKSGKGALSMGTVLIVSVLFAGAILFWFIITTLQKQNQLITALNAKDAKLSEAARIKDNFLANMSHEIRTPLTAILGFTSLLRDSPLTREQDEYVATIHRSGENLLDIINDILDLSKIEAGMMRIESAPFSIRDIVHSTATMFHSQVLDKNLQLSVHIDERVPDMLEGDAMRLTQILVNLISNAIKFTRQGSITITVSGEGMSEGVIRTGIAVADTGIGIEKDKQKNIFDRFQQAEDFVTRKYGGTGLGLSIVKNLVILQGGEISVDSELDRGTTFHLVIPYRISPEHALERMDSSRYAEMPDLKGIRVLAAEDNELNQRLIKHLFTKWFLEFDLVANGAEALLKSEKKKYDLILMDIQMPVMDGYSAAMQIRNKQKSNVPIIAMTAHALAGERDKCIRYGMNDCISKPINEKELLTLIRQYTAVPGGATNGEPGKPVRPAGHFQYIDLSYMSEVSMGNRAYEKEITGLFIHDIPEELAAIKASWDTIDITRLRHLAHNMKTSVSVMGLEAKLQPTLDSLEKDDLDQPAFMEKFSHLQAICDRALQEARDLYEYLASTN